MTLRDGGMVCIQCINTNTHFNFVIVNYIRTVYNLYELGQKSCELGKSYFSELMSHCENIATKMLVHCLFGWQIERIIWIGYMKNVQNKQSCLLARLPKDIIKMILSWLVLLSNNAVLRSKLVTLFKIQV